MTEYELGSWLSTLLQERDALLYDNVDAYKREYSDFRAPVCREDRQGLDDFLHKKIEDTDELFHIGPYQYIREYGLQRILRILELELLWEKAPEIGLIDIPNLCSQLESDAVMYEYKCYDVHRDITRPVYIRDIILDLTKLYEAFRDLLESNQDYVGWTTSKGDWYSGIELGSDRHITYRKTKNFVLTPETMLFAKSKMLEHCWLFSGLRDMLANQHPRYEIADNIDP